jgi:integrase
VNPRYARTKRAGAEGAARPAAHDDWSVMSKQNRTGISERHARSCAGSPCTCTPTFKATVWDARAGKRIIRSFPTITAARQWRQDAYAALRAGTLSAERGPTLEDAAEAWLEAARAGIVRSRSGERYKPATIRSYEQHLRLRILPALGRERLGEVSLPQLQRYVDRLAADGLAAQTIGLSVAPLRAIYARANRLGEVNFNPTRGLALPAPRTPDRRIAAPAEIERVLEAVAPGDRALWATAVYAGLRRGELCALRWDDVDLAAGVIHVRRGWDVVEGEIEPKSRHGRRRVPIPAVLRDHLVERKLAGDSTLVFGGANRARKMIERGAGAMRAAGIKPLAIHDARHTYASLMIAAGVNAKALSTYMGHATIAITYDLYGHLMPGNEDEAADLLDAFLTRTLGSAEVEHPAAKVMTAGTASTTAP